ncbi:MAG TPA: cell wall-active antibiotics response protein LiaF [Bacteroidota bacterium]|nr:cell wall-active antibiotics response protein LiaF [Bacteroidota bacterium]
MGTRNQISYGGIILVVIGVMFLLDTLNIANFGHMVSMWWPLILILVGINIVMRQKREQRARIGDTQEAVFGDTAHQDVKSNSISYSNVFGDLDVKITSQEFRGGFVSTTFGDSHIDLSAVEMAFGESLLRIDGVFGDVHVLAPRNCGIMVTAKTVFGDVSVMGGKKSGFAQEVLQKSDGYDDAPKKLKIYLNQVFGDVRVW